MSFVGKPVLIFIPPFFPFDVILQCEISEIAKIFVILITYSDVVPSGKSRRTR
jgi:hypothetical protein